MEQIVINSTDSLELENKLYSIKRVVSKSLPTLYSSSNVYRIYDTSIMDHKTYIFLQTMYTLERLFFNKLDTYNTLTATTRFPDTYSYITNEIPTLNNLKSGFVYAKVPRTRYVELNNAKHLTAAEEAFKIESHHFLKIFTLNKALIIFTNKPLPFQSIVKLKILQWTISKSEIEVSQPAVFDFLNSFLDPINLEKINTAIKEILALDVLKQYEFNELKEMFKTNYKRKVQDLHNKLSNKEQDYRITENSLSHLATEIRQLLEEINLVEEMSKKEEDNTPFIKFLLNHPYITKIEKLNSHSVEIYYEAPILYFDDDIIKRILHNYTASNKAILRAFMDNKYELITRCKFKFHTDTFEVQLGYLGNGNVIGHPHIDQYNCFGNHRLAIHEAAKTGNYYGAIEQLSQAVLNMNFSDSVVTNGMLHTLNDNIHLKTWRSKETGVMLSTQEVMEEYRDNEEA